MTLPILSLSLLLLLLSFAGKESVRQANIRAGRRDKKDGELKTRQHET